MGSKNKDTTKKTSIGGQALIEGIMMKGVSKGAMAVRLPDGSIDVEDWDIKPKKWYNKCPVIRGSINFVQQLREGYSCLMKSADKSGMMDDDSEEEQSKFEKWLDDKFGDKLTGGKPHDGRAPDYDDWSLNGDILFWFEHLNCALEISSMGIRVEALVTVEAIEDGSIILA